jgi:hypothetical protein
MKKMVNYRAVSKARDKLKKSPVKRSTKRTDGDGLTYLTVNGEQICVVTAAARRKYDLDPRDLRIPLGSGKYMYEQFMNRDKLYKAAGYDVSKIDFAYPVTWARLPEIKKRLDKGDRPVWSYEKDRYGAPVWDSEARRKLKAIINRRLAARK